MFALPCEVILAQTLIIFGYGVPTGSVFNDAMLLHVQINEVFLLHGNSSEVMQEVPTVHVKRVFDVSDERTFASFGDEVVSPRVTRLRIRNTNRHLVRHLSSDDDIFRLLDKSNLQQFGLYAPLDEFHRFATPVAVNKPLTELAWHLYVDLVFAHDDWFCCKDRR